MAPESEIVYREKFSKKYNGLFHDAWKNRRLNPFRGAFWLKTLSTQRMMESRRRENETGQLIIPPVMIFSVTRQCNLSCKGCYAAHRSDIKSGELPVERIGTLFQEASDLGIGVIMITGGEPLMRPEILWAASEHRHIIFPVFTNGLLLNESTVSYFKHHRNLIPILSIEGNRHFTDARRGKGVYTRLLQNLALLRKTRRMFGMSVTLTRENFEEVTDPLWVDDFVKRGCKLFFMIEYVPQSEAELSLCLTNDQKEKIQHRLERLRTQLHILIVNLPGDEDKYGGCLASGRGFVHVSANGDLEPCPFAPYSDVNIRNKTLREALKSPFLNRIRDSHHLLSEARGACTLWENREWVNLQLEQKVI